jgi:hypothetical protein
VKRSRWTVDGKDANVENVGVVVKQQRGIIMWRMSGGKMQSAGRGRRKESGPRWWKSRKAGHKMDSDPSQQREDEG